MKNFQLQQIIRKEIKKVLLKEYAIQDTKYSSHLSKVLDALQISKSELEIIAKKIANKKFVSNSVFKSLAKENLFAIHELGILNENPVLKSHVLKILKITESKNKNKKILSETISYQDYLSLNLDEIDKLPTDELIQFREDIEKKYREVEKEIASLEKDKSVSMSQLVVKKALLKNLNKFALTSASGTVTSMIYVFYKLFEEMSILNQEREMSGQIFISGGKAQEAGMNFLEYCIEFFKHLNSLFHMKLPTLSAEFLDYSSYFLFAFLMLITFSSSLWLSGVQADVDQLESLPNKEEAIRDLKLDLRKIGKDNIAVINLLSKRGIRI
jgi:hypothetical protein